MIAFHLVFLVSNSSRFMSVVQELLTKIQSHIEQTNLNDTFDEKGEVIEVKDGVATISGMRHVKFSEIIEFESGLK